jgi:hypothetical protein
VRNTNKISFRNPEGKRLLGTHRPRQEDNIKVDQKETVCDGVDWIHLAQDREQGNKPLDSMKVSEFLV